MRCLFEDVHQGGWDRSDVKAFDAPSDRWIWHVVGVERFSERDVRVEAFEVWEETWGQSEIIAYREPYEVLYRLMVGEELDVDSIDVGG